MEGQNIAPYTVWLIASSWSGNCGHVIGGLYLSAASNGNETGNEPWVIVRQMTGMIYMMIDLPE